MFQKEKFLMLLSYVDSQKDEYSTEESNVCDWLVQYCDGAEERHEGLGIHIVRCTDGAELLQYEVPRIEAEHRSYDGEEEHIACYDRDGESVKMEATTHTCRYKGQHGDNTIEKDLACDEPCGITSIEAAHYHTIHCPGESCYKSEGTVAPFK